MAKTRRLTVTCPECEAHLVLDAATGEVLEHRAVRRPPAGGKDFEALLADLDRGTADAQEVFEREVAAQKDRDRLLEEKFRQAIKRAEEEPDDKPPPRPFDFD